MTLFSEYLKGGYDDAMTYEEWLEWKIKYLASENAQLQSSLELKDAYLNLHAAEHGHGDLRKATNRVRALEDKQ